MIHRYKVTLLNQEMEQSIELIKCSDSGLIGEALNKLEELGFMVQRLEKLKTRIKKSK